MDTKMGRGMKEERKEGRKGLKYWKSVEECEKKQTLTFRKLASHI